MTIETVIQNIVLPTADYENARPLYVKGYTGSFPIIIPKGDSIDLRTFFNMFPSGKYRKFADIDEIILRMDCEGSPTVEICRFRDSGCDTESRKYEGDMHIGLRDEYLIGIVIKADESDVVIRNGCFLTTKEPVNDVHLAHLICTYRREGVVKEKLDWICSKCKDDQFMKDRLTVYLIDNGNSFSYGDENVKVIPSPNLGGSGGFSRGMLEAINDGISTHATLNDDDAMLDPETIRRTISFYSLLSEENKELVIGGTLFDKKDLVTVHEAGAFCRNGNLFFNDKMDATTPEGCVEIEGVLSGNEKDSYFAWCYTTIPCDVIRKYGLGLPLFFQYDDVEYSLRLKDVPKIIMCGLAVWHPFVKGRSVNREYFALRNTLVAMASNGLLGDVDFNELFMKMVKEVGGYRYRIADAELQALRDFRSGPEKVFGLIRKGYSFFEEYKYGEPETNKGLTSKEFLHGRLFSILTFNGVFFPSVGNKETDMYDTAAYAFYRKGKVFYISTDGREVVCERSASKTISQTFKIAWNILMVRIKKKKLNRKYSEALIRYSSENHWRELFHKDKQ